MKGTTIKNMGYFKQLHIDCTEYQCTVGDPDHCYMLTENEEILDDFDE